MLPRQSLQAVVLTPTRGSKELICWPFTTTQANTTVLAPSGRLGPPPVTMPAQKPADAMPNPQVVGRYALFDEIASGGMATVHLGRLTGSAGFSRTIAIKRLHPQFAKDPEFVSMFLDEARLASRIQHPNVVATLDVVAVEGEVFLVMEYVGGEALSRLMRNSFAEEAQIRSDVAVSIICDMLHGLHAAHEATSETGEPLKIVHRDVSPQNVLVGLDGVARVLDFGVAKASMRAQSTREGQVKGKLSYMSPEQVRAKEVDRRADVFAVGVVAWEILCGQRLFAGDDAGEIFGKLLQGDIPTPNEVLEKAGKRLVPAGVNDAVAKALAREADERFATARDFAIALEAAIAVAPPHRVGEWVQRFAGPQLEGRQRMVAQIERYVFPVNEELTPNPISVAGYSVVEPSDDATRKDVFAARTPVSVPLTEPIETYRPPRGRRSKAVLVLLLLGLLIFGFVMMTFQGEQPRARPEPTATPAQPTATAREPETTAEPSAQLEEPEPDSESEPAPAASASVQSEPEATPEPEASATAKGSAPSKPVLPRVSPRPRVKPDPCNPPYRIDDRGIKRPKPECI